VVAALQQQCAGKMLLGHGLAKDLAALRMSHPQHLLFDTMTHPAFCNKVGAVLGAEGWRGNVCQWLCRDGLSQWRCACRRLM
jgi:hypothetical protein